MTNFAPGIDGNYKGEIDNINSFIGDIDPKNVFLRDYEALINLDLSDFYFTGISIDDVLSFLPPELRTGHVVSILQQILDGDLSLVIQGQSLIRDLFNKYGPNTSLFDAMEMEGYFGEESGGGASLPDYLFNLPDDFGYSTLQDIAGAIVSPLYDLHADGSWNVENLSLPDSAEGVLGDVRDDLFDQIGVTAIDQLVDVAADKLGRYGELFKDAVGLVKDSLDVKKIVGNFIGDLLNQVEVGFDAVSGENDITFEEYDQMTERNVDKFRAEAREFLVEKHGEIGGVVSDIFSGKVFGLSEVNSFRAVIFEEGALITGGNKKDSFVGSDASDHFLVSPGGDAILSLGGNDIFEMKAGYGGSKLSGGQGFDQLNVDGSSTSFQYVKGKTEGTLTGRDGSVAIADIERIHFSDKTLALDTESGQNAGQAYRVYQAAFARKPDAEGLTYWVNSLDKGSTLKDVANAFLESKEFMNTYGASPSNEAIVSKMYQNILGREPEAEGYNHWVGVLQRGAIDRGDLLSAFAESAENIKLVAPVLTSGVWLDA